MHSDWKWGAQLLVAALPGWLRRRLRTQLGVAAVKAPAASGAWRRDPPLGRLAPLASGRSGFEEACGTRDTWFYSRGSEARGRPGWFRGLAASGVSPRPLGIHWVLLSRLLWVSGAPTCRLRLSLPASPDVSHEVAKNFLSGGAGAQWGSQTFPLLTLGMSRRACSPRTLGPAAFKVPAAPAFPPSLGPGKGTTATVSSSPHAQLLKPRRPLGGLVLLSFSCLFPDGRRA